METHQPESESKPSVAVGKLPSPSTSPAPSRLQKRAPAALRLDGIRTGSTKVHPSPETSSSSLGAIPLLSPIALLSPFLDSPPPRREPEAESAPVFPQATDIIMGTAQDMVDQVQGPTTPVFGGWQQPAATTEPSKMFSLFHSQCSLVNPTQ